MWLVKRFRLPVALSRARMTLTQIHRIKSLCRRARAWLTKSEILSLPSIAPGGEWAHEILQPRAREQCKNQDLRARASSARAPLDSVSLCTRFSGFSTISSFGCNCLSSKLVGMFLEIVPMFVRSVRYIAEKLENRVHKLTDSNVSPSARTDQ